MKTIRYSRACFGRKHFLRGHDLDGDRLTQTKGSMLEVVNAPTLTLGAKKERESPFQLINISRKPKDQLSSLSQDEQQKLRVEKYDMQMFKTVREKNRLYNSMSFVSLILT